MNKHKATQGKFIKHIPCSECGSSDGLALYDKDGKVDGFCWVCQNYFNNPLGAEVIPLKKDRNAAIPALEEVLTYPYANLHHRSIGFDFAKMFDIRASVDPVTGEQKNVYFIYKDLNGNPVGYKGRSPDKKFWSLGLKGSPLFGAQLCGKAGKLLIITEGEFDAVAATQLLKESGKNYRVVSLPSGANNRAIEDNLEWIEKYETVMLCFDSDEPGQKAAKKAAESISPGKAQIVHLPEKDVNEMLIKGRGKDFLRSLYSSEPYRPDGIVGIADIYQEAITPPVWGKPWPWEKLTKLTYGRRRKELYGFGGGTGCGKTEGFKEIIQHIITKDKLPVGLFFLEEAPAHTAKVIAGKIHNKRFHLPDGGWTEKEIQEGIKELDGWIYLYNHFGHKDWEAIKSKMRYMVVSLGIKDIFLDHLTALVSSEEDPNRALGEIMEEMASLTQELDVTIYFISHLSTPQGVSHEEGGRVTMSQFRGSRTIGFWSNYVFGYERNQQADDVRERNTVSFRVLKDRLSGLATGETFKLEYNHNTGRFLEGDNVELEL